MHAELQWLVGDAITPKASQSPADESRDVRKSQAEASIKAEPSFKFVQIRVEGGGSSANVQSLYGLATSL